MPTAPVAPLTTTGPASGRRPPASKRSSAIATVKAGTPSSAVSRALRPAGSRITWAACTLTRSAKPPSNSMPVLKPCTSTSSPGAKADASLCSTVPTSSMPGTRGLPTSTLARPVTARLSL